MHIRYTEENLTEAIREAINWAEVCRYFCLSTNGGSGAHLKKVALKFGIDFSHFTGTTRIPVGNAIKRGWKNILTYSKTVKPPQASTLRRALVDSGRPYVCELCGQDNSWNGNVLILQVDHKNGNRFDNTITNLRFLCPNCHTQTLNWGKKGLTVAVV